MLPDGTLYEKASLQALTDIVRILGKIETLLMNQGNYVVREENVKPRNPLPKAVEGWFNVKDKEGNEYQYLHRVILDVSYKAKDDFLKVCRSEKQQGKWGVLLNPWRDGDAFFWLVYSDDATKLKEIAKYVVDNLEGEIIQEPSD